MKVWKIYSVLVLLFFSPTAFSQFGDIIRTGRPGQAIGPYAAGVRVFQVQSGIDFGGSQNTQTGLQRSFINPNTVFRFGVTRKFEINSAWAYRHDQYSFSSVSDDVSGLSGATIGSRINIIEGKNFIPGVGIQVTAKLPILSPGYDFNHIAPRFLLICNQKLSEKFSFLVNLGLDYNGVTPEPKGVYVANLSYTLSDKWGAFIENYGNVGNTTLNTFWDAGFSYLINPHFQLDFYGGTSINTSEFNYFSSFGLSWRFVKWHTNFQA